MTWRIGSKLGVAALALLFFSSVGIAPANADDDDDRKGHRGGYHGQNWVKGQEAHGRRPGRWSDQHHRGQVKRGHLPGPDIHRDSQWPSRHAHEHKWHARHGKTVFVPVYRTRYYRDVVVVRRHGHVYSGYGHHRDDEAAYRWLAFTAITLKILDNLNEAQERAHEQAQLEATRAAVGETIVWSHSGASGEVSVLRDGYSTTGRYCREFQQVVTIGGRSERAYGTACQQPDGSWQVVSTS
ncbi:MAG TPA: hypothetical protein VED46_02145 [Alphaproteobacteria bacterium]|nr:hypothetical protein [Alphaproteobacteria bacterium]